MLPYLTGNTQNSTTAEFLEMMQATNVTASVFLEKHYLGQASHTALVLLDAGKIKKNYSFDLHLANDETQLDFIYFQHDMQGHIELPSRFPHSLNPIMRALPALPEQSILLRQGQDFTNTLNTINPEGFSGYIRLETNLAQGFMLIKEGQISTAIVESDGKSVEDNDALRSLRSLTLESDSKLSFRALSISILEGLMSLAAGNKSHGMMVFNGLEASEQGYAFFKDGKTIVRTQAELIGAAAYFPNLTTAPTLAMPDEPPGWEQNNYALTLRGKDALNSITELAVQFQADFGDQGKHLLERIPKDKSPNVLTETTKLTLTDLKSWLDKLEQEGMIRQVLSKPST